MKNILYKSRSYLLYCSILFISLEIIELVFKFNTFSGYLDFQMLRIAIFNLVFSMLVSLILCHIKWEISRVLLGIILLFMATYAIAQMEFSNFMGNYFSWVAVNDGAGRIKDYIVQFILFIPFSYYLVYIPVILYLILLLTKKIRIETTPFKWKNCLITFCVIILLHGTSLLTLNASSYNSDLWDLYGNTEFQELGLREFGVVRFCFRDFRMLFIPRQKISLSVEEPIDEIEEPDVSEEDPIDNTRYLDDTKWKQLMEAETDEDIKMVDEYLMSRPITDKNEMTGLFEGKNFIFVMVEAFDFMAIDEELTPTLYKMMTQGWFFSNYYTPKYSCTTGESEFISETSLIPSGNLCTPNTYSDNIFSESIFELFNRKGYTTSSYHNWNDEFYERKTIHKNMGSMKYMDLDDLDIPIIQGWQSDVDLIETAYPEFVQDEQPFFAYIITSSTHFPYDQSSTLGDRYLSEINKVYPNMPTNIKRYLSKAMELDASMARLLELLEEDGLLEDTYIWVFADHHPLKTSLSQIAENTRCVDIDRLEGQNIDRTPNFLYNPNLEATEYTMTASTFDLLPTVANLFGLNYDPRYYVGVDLFSNVPATVIFANGDWITDKGIYRVSEGEFQAFDESFKDSKYVENVITRVDNLFKVSNLIYRTDYFNMRDFEVVEKISR